MRFVNYNNRRALEKELKKCEVVCANCHRTRSYNRLATRTISKAELTVDIHTD